MDTIIHFSTLDHVLLVIIAVTVILFFVLGVALIAASLVLVAAVKRMVTKAELAIDAVETASQTVRDMSAQVGGPLAAIKIIKAIIDVTHGRKK